MAEHPSLDVERWKRFAWETDDVEWLSAEQARLLLGDVAFMPRVARQLAKALEDRVREVGISTAGENSVLRPLLLEMLRREFDPWCVLTELDSRIPDWDGASNGKLGGVDVVVTDGVDGSHLYLMELKWCHDARTLGWTLWDLYKMVAGRRLAGVEGCYLVVGAPVRVWHEERAWACGALFANGRWDSAEVFRRYWIAWLDLLGGGSARPSQVPAEIDTRLLADEPIATAGEPWSLRALAVEPAGDEWLAFDGDWPQGGWPTPEQIATLDSLPWKPLGAHALHQD